MLKRFDFSFSNEAQKLHLEAKVSEFDLIYKIHEAEGFDGLKASDEWQIYSSDAVMWLKSFIELRIFNWDSSYSNASISDYTLKKAPKWQLEVEEDEESNIPVQHVVGLNSYPYNFPAFLDLIKQLLGLPYLVLEV